MNMQVHHEISLILKFTADQLSCALCHLAFKSARILYGSINFCLTSLCGSLTACNHANVMSLTLSLLAAAFFHLLMTLANGVDPDQDRQNVGPDLDPNRLTL